jgi:hypothetical protein
MLARSEYAQTFRTFTVYEFIRIQRSQNYGNKTLTLVHWKKAFILPLFVYNAISDIFLPVPSCRQENYSYPYKYIFSTLCLCWCVICVLPILRGSLFYHIMTFVLFEDDKDGSCRHVRRSHKQPTSNCILGSCHWQPLT